MCSSESYSVCRSFLGKNYIIFGPYRLSKHNAGELRYWIFFRITGLVLVMIIIIIVTIVGLRI